MISRMVTPVFDLISSEWELPFSALSPAIVVSYFLDLRPSD